MVYDAYPANSATGFDGTQMTLFYMQATDALTTNVGVNSKKYTFVYQYNPPVTIDQSLTISLNFLANCNEPITSTNLDNIEPTIVLSDSGVGSQTIKTITLVVDPWTLVYQTLEPTG